MPLRTFLCWVSLYSTSTVRWEPCLVLTNEVSSQHGNRNCSNRSVSNTPFNCPLHGSVPQSGSPTAAPWGACVQPAALPSKCQYGTQQGKSRCPQGTSNISCFLTFWRLISLQFSKAYAQFSGRKKKCQMLSQEKIIKKGIEIQKFSFSCFQGLSGEG